MNAKPDEFPEYFLLQDICLCGAAGMGNYSIQPTLIYIAVCGCLTPSFFQFPNSLSVIPTVFLSWFVLVVVFLSSKENML